MLSNTFSGLSLIGFLILLGLYLLFLLIYIRVFRRYLKQIITERGGSGFDTTFLVIERLFILIMALIILLLFVRLNPLPNGIIVLILLLAFGSFIYNYCLGISLIGELRLEINKPIAIGKYSGILRKIGFLGLFASKGDVLSFFSYRKLLNTRIDHGSDNLPVLTTLLVRGDRETTMNAHQKAIEEIILNFPLNIAVQNSNIKISGDDIIVGVAVQNSKHFQSLIQQLEINGYKVSIK